MTKELSNYMRRKGLLDIWRMNHPNQRKFTWARRNPTKLGRLDYFLMSDTLLPLYADSYIKSSYRSDHSPIGLDIYIQKNPKGRGFWKINNSLLLDPKLNSDIKKEMSLIVKTYACTPYHPKFVENYLINDIDIMIDIKTFWDTLHAQIRGLIISYSGKKKKQQNMEENQLNKNIELLEEEFHLDPNNHNTISSLKKNKDKLQEIRELKLKGALLRSRTMIANFNEKPTKYFLNLENKNFISKNIRELKLSNGNKINKPKEILKEMWGFYTDLYNKQDTIRIEETSFKGIEDQLPKLNDTEKIDLEGKITTEEIIYVIKKSKNNKSPGPDGFSNEFYKIFWPELGQWMTKLFDNYRETNKLNESQLGGIITCIPKGEKNRNEIKNWRPITLLNSTYKFYSSILAERIRSTLNNLIHTDQKGFIKNRFIGENIRLTYDMINFCNEYKIKGLIVLVDFQKAFDSIDWDFISKTLKLFNFGDSIIKWINAIQQKTFSYIVQNGHISDKVLLHRGCRQGNPVSPYIFVLAAEIMAAAIRANKKIQGIEVYGDEKKISLYADDTTLYLLASERNLRAALDALQEFRKISGLKINIEKTKIIKIGEWGDSRISYCKERDLIWTAKFTSLGIIFDANNLQDITEINIENKIVEINKLIRIWTPRLLTTIGKITIIKSLLTSKFIHILLSLPSPKKETFLKIELIYKKFLWGSKPPKFKKAILQNPVEQGGLKYLNLEIFDKALKTTWVRRIINEDEGWATFPHHYKIHRLFLFGNIYFDTIRENCTNQFWKDVIASCKLLYQCIWATGNINSKDMPIWYNQNVCTYFNREWFEHGIICVGDLFENSTLMSLEQLRDRGLRCNFLEHEFLRRKIIQLDMQLDPIPEIGPSLPVLLNAITLGGKGCSMIYKKLDITSYSVLLNVQDKWELILNEDVSLIEISRSFINIQKIPKCTYNKYVQFKIMHDRLNTRQLLYKMNIFENNFCLYCLNENEIDTTLHALIECPSTALLWREIEVWLRLNVDAHIKLSNKEKIFGYQEKNQNSYIINLIIMNTKIVIYKRRPDKGELKIFEILRLTYYEMKCDQYEYELANRIELFEIRWERVKNVLCNQFEGTRL